MTTGWAAQKAFPDLTVGITTRFKRREFSTHIRQVCVLFDGALIRSLINVIWFCVPTDIDLRCGWPIRLYKDCVRGCWYFILDEPLQKINLFGPDRWRDQFVRDHWYICSYGYNSQIKKTCGRRMYIRGLMIREVCLATYQTIRWGEFWVDSIRPSHQDNRPPRWFRVVRYHMYVSVYCFWLPNVTTAVTDLLRTTTIISRNL